MDDDGEAGDGEAGGGGGGGAACAASASASSGSWNCAAPSTNSSVQASSISSAWSTNGSATNAGRFLTHLTDMKSKRAAASQTSSAAQLAGEARLNVNDVVAPAAVDVDVEVPAAAAAVWNRY